MLSPKSSLRALPSTMLSCRYVLRCLQQTRGFKSQLLQNGAKAFINGKWIKTANGREFEVTDPFTKEKLYDVANCTTEDAELAVAAAKQAFPQWAWKTTAKERGAILRRWYEVMAEKEEAMAELLTREQGKPLHEAKMEIQYAHSFLDWYAGEARRIYGQVVPASRLDRQHLHLREPIGVVCAITPWNFPSAMIARKAGAALAAGCTMIVKPAEDTPLSALALAQTAEEAGLPPGVFNVLPSDRTNTQEISTFVCESPDVHCISFTGSTVVGKILSVQSASTVKRLCLELGGNAPLIVFPSADLDQAVQGTIASKFRCSGQTCVSSNRFFVHDSIHDQFVEKLQAAISSQLKCGNGMEKGTTQGPLINQRAVDKVLRLLEDATGQEGTGAKLICGGKAIPDSTLFEPTILVDVDPKCLLARSEIFGPVVAIQRFHDEEEVIKRANSARTGLAGYVFTKDLSQVHRLMRQLMQVGMLGINEGAISCAEAAFGGVKESGLGREGASQGIDEFTQWKYVCLNTL